MEWFRWFRKKWSERPKDSKRDEHFFLAVYVSLVVAVLAFALFGKGVVGNIIELNSDTLLSLSVIIGLAVCVGSFCLWIDWKPFKSRDTYLILVGLVVTVSFFLLENTQTTMREITIAEISAFMDCGTAEYHTTNLNGSSTDSIEPSVPYVIIPWDTTFAFVYQEENPEAVDKLSEVFGNTNISNTTIAEVDEFQPEPDRKFVRVWAEHILTLADCYRLKEKYKDVFLNST